MKKILVLLLVFCANILLATQIKDTTFLETELRLKTPTGTLVGTLCTSKKLKKTPIALIISGSGPTDRNGNNPMMQNNSLQFLAQDLAKKGIASIRYDKRGVGESSDAGIKESELRFDQYIQDAADWVAFIKKDKRFSKTTVIGHSEGSLVGMNAAKKANQFISLAGPGSSIDIVLKEQLKKQSLEVKNDAYAILDSLKAGKTVKNIKPIFNTLFRESVQPYMISWMQHDPQKDIALLKIPVLIVQGTEDLQVSVEDAEKLALAQPNAKKVLIENMNHLFKTVTNDNKENYATYNNPKLAISTVLVDEISQFIFQNKKKTN